MLLKAPRVPALTCCVCAVCAEGLPHSVPGEGAGESEGGAGDQEQPAASEGEEADGDGQTGGCRSVSVSADLRIPYLAASAASRESPVVCDSEALETVVLCLSGVTAGVSAHSEHPTARLEERVRQSDGLAAFKRIRPFSST